MRNTENRISSGTGHANMNNWVTEDSFWRSNYASRPYTTEVMDYEVYRSAYRYGYDLYRHNLGKPFNQLDENIMRHGWETSKQPWLKWDYAKDAVRDAYDRLLNIAPNPKGAKLAHEYRHEPA